MHYYISSILDRSQEIGRGEGVVDDEWDLVCVCDGGYGFDVDEVRVGVAETLDENGLGLRLYRFLEVGQVGRIHECGRDAVGDQRVLKQVISTSVDVFGGHDMVSRTCDVKDGISDCGGAGGHGQRADAPFERSDALLEDVLGGVGQAAVDIARIGQAETRGCVLGIVEYV